MLIDTHCHLDASEFSADRLQVAQQARAGGVGGVVVPAVDRASLASTRQLCQQLPGWAWPAYGLHPLYVAAHQPEDLLVVRRLLDEGQAVAVGEIGLDGFVAGLDMARQEWFFVEQLKLARELDLPVILHVRRAVDLVLRQLRRLRPRGGIAHAFNGSAQQAQQLIDAGFCLGFGGAMTWERALNIRRLARDLPLEALVLETDAPDIPPAWDAHGRNTPANLPRIAQVLAEVRGASLEQVVHQTGLNARRVLRFPGDAAAQACMPHMPAI